MNFVFVSPHFPTNYPAFCSRLKENGVNVLGIGDAAYDSLPEELKNSLTEYYKVESMENYDSMMRAMGYFVHKYGRIDWVESNNEYWLEQDAQLRSDFNICTGLKAEEIERYKSKSGMKAYYERAGVPVARYILLDGKSLEADRKKAMAFIKKAGWPVVAKPDKGVGASDNWKIGSEEQLDAFLAGRRGYVYIMEEFVKGEVATFDGISGPDAKPIIALSHVTPSNIMDMVNNKTSLWYYVDKNMPANLRRAGEATLKAFDAKNRFFHCEFFRLTEDKPGLGKKGDIIGLEVNMRPAGGFTVDMMNYAGEIDLYGIWADMVAFGEARRNIKRKAQFCGCAGRRDHIKYLHTHEEIMAQYGSVLKMERRLPPAIAAGMADQLYIATLADKKALDAFRDFVLQPAAEQE